MPRPPWGLLALYRVAALVVAAGMAISRWASGAGNPYADWRTINNVSCCSEADCAPVGGRLWPSGLPSPATAWRIGADRYELFINGEWVPVMMGLLDGLWVKLAGFAVIALGVIGAYFKIRADGKAAARAEQTRKNEETRDAMDAAKAKAPRDTDELIKRLRDGGGF